MKSFFVTAKFQMKLANGVTGVDGGIMMPSKLTRHTVERRDVVKDYPHLATRYLDPQVYLSTLNAGTARTTCARLTSWGWFPGAVLPTYDSAKQKQADWMRDAEQRIINGWTGQPPTTDAEIEDSVRMCVDTQQGLGCAGVILPCPLTADAHSKFETEVHWLETGLAIAERVAPGLPRYASIALSDNCLRGVDPWKSILLDAILDQVTAREPEGVYLLVELANEDVYYATDPNTIGSILRLVDGFKRSGIRHVVVAYAGTAGLMALAAGADAWTSGWYRGERRMRLRDYYQDDGPRAYPAYYSHPLAAEFHMDSDLDRAVVAGFLPRIVDATYASAGLLQALQSGQGASAAVEWQYRPANIEASKQHFLTACVRETRALRAQNDQGIDSVLRWLENAAVLANDLFSQVGQFNPRTSLSHQHNWLAAFQKYVASR